MATDTMLVSIEIILNSKQIVPWTIIPVESSLTIDELCKKLFSGKFKEIEIVKEQIDENKGLKYDVFVGRNKTAENDKIFPTVKISEVVELFGRYLKVKFSEKKNDLPLSDDPMSQKKSAFAVLLEAREKMKLPQRPNENNKRDVLTKLFIDWLDGLELGFSPDGVDTIGKNFVTTVTNVIWYIDPYVSTMDERSCKVPQALNRFFGLNNPKLRKQKIPAVESHRLLEHATNIDSVIEMPFMNTKRWEAIRTLLAELADNTHKFLRYLQKQRQKVAENRSLEHPVRTPSEAEKLVLIHPNTNVKPTFVARYKPLVDFIKAAEYNTALCIDHFSPDDVYERRYYFQNIQTSIPVKVHMYSYAYGNNLGTYHFIWKIDPAMDDNETMTQNTIITNEIKEKMPKFHTRQMKKKFINTCGRLCNLKSSYLRTIYRRLSGDDSVNENATTKQVDERVEAAFEMEDPDIVVDLRKHNEGTSTVYNAFFEKCKLYLENVVEKTCDDRRHEDKLTYLATAISIPDLRNEVAKTCDENTQIPSEQWLRFQFAPKNPHAASSFRYTGNLNIKYMVQSRVFRKKHEDDHYCAALFRYLREMAIELKDHTNFVAMDDKHYCKVGEPGNPLAAVERGKQVLIAGDKIFAASDHDFAKCSVIPSVTMKIDIPDQITDSFYRGQVYVGLKDHVFESSSPTRHMAELQNILNPDGNIQDVKPVLLLYTDGGPDHRVNFMSVKASLISLFKALDLDMLVAVRTAPNASWRNPPERIMSILNLALNCVGLMRREMSQEFENYIKSCNTMNNIRASAEKHEGLHEAFVDSLEPVKILLGGLFSRLSLKGKQFKIFQAATDEEISVLWGFIRAIDGSIGEDDKSAADLKGKKSLEEFVDHCCISRHYFFVIKKCGSQNCSICSPPRSPADIFASLHQIPDPVPDGDHYKPFHELYGKVNTSEMHRPSLKKENTVVMATNKRTVPIKTSAQTANSVKSTVQCTECNKPRVLYSQKALSSSEKQILMRFLQFYHYTCGADIQTLKNDKAPRVCQVLEKVFVRDHSCCDDVELPYFSSKAFVDICVKCGSKNNLQKQGSVHPMCQDCHDKCSTVPVAVRSKRSSSATSSTVAKKSKK